MPPYLPRKRLRSTSPDRTVGPKAKALPAVPTKRPTLFDDLDAGASTPSSAGKRRSELFSAQPETSDESELSSLSSTPDPDGGIQNKRQKLNGESSDRAGIENDYDDDDDDEDIEFEDVDTTQVPQPETVAPGPSGDLDLTLTKETRISLTNPHGTKKGPSKIERQIRIVTHNLHVQMLLWHNALRNAWLCDQEVQSILLSQLPPGVEKEIDRWRVDSGLERPVVVKGHASDKSKGKNKGKGKGKPTRSGRDWSSTAEVSEPRAINMSRGDPLIRLLKILSAYWRKRFHITAPGLRKLGYMPLERLDDEMKSFHKEQHDPERHGERIRNIEEFRRSASFCEGSRDVGAQLFTALLRSIGLEARLVASLQPVGFSWTKNEEASPRKKKREVINLEDDISSSSDSESEEPVKPQTKPRTKPTTRPVTQESRRSSRANGKAEAPIEIDDSQGSGIDESDESEIDFPLVASKGSTKSYDRDLLYPHYWCEVLSPVTQKYLPVDPVVLNVIATNDELLAKFEPRNAKAEKAKQVIAYVVGYSPDGTAKDVTVRYLKRHMFPGKTKGVRVPVEKVPVYNSKGKVKRHEEYDWFKHVMSGYVRSEYRRKNKSGMHLKQARTEVDEKEETTDLKPVKPEKKEVKEGEETLQYYKSSAEYVLERHLRREEALIPGAKHVKLFAVKGKGGSSVEEKVFLRKDVVHCKSIETWHKEGRAPKPGEQALKMVPYRAATTNRRRELAEAEAATGEKMLQGLYSWDQTDWIIPPPIENGVIPKNAYGNMDVYVPSMVPQGAIHLPRRGMARICKKLNIDYAEAVTGFEFGHRMAVPVIEGVVIAEEHAEMVWEQWEIEEAERVRKEDEKRTKAALGMWRKFLMGMRIIERVRDEYGDEVDDATDAVNPWTNRNATAKKEEEILEESLRRAIEKNDEDMAGGFFPEGHHEEEVSQNGGFFVARHEDEDDADGGFIVEHEYDVPNTNSMSKIASKQALTTEDDEFEDEQEPEPAKPLVQLSGGTRGKPINSTRKPKSTPRGKSSAPTTRGTPMVKKSNARQVEDQDEDDESSLSELSSSSGPEDFEEQSVPSTSRSLPRRTAARKSQAALRSHYFHHSDEDVDISNDEDDDDDE